MKETLDTIIIADTCLPRAEEVRTVLGLRAKEVCIIPMDDLTAGRAVFEKIIMELLGEGRNVMVVFNITAGVRGEIYSLLRRAEVNSGKGTRRILLSCLPYKKVTEGFKQRDLERAGLRHIRYDSQDSHHVRKLEELF